jgi:hypothetical protein
MKNIWVFLILQMLNQICHAQLEKFNMQQVPPIDTPKIFLKGVSERIAISADQTEIYFNDSIGTSYFKYENGTWNGPKNLLTNYGCPSLSLNGKIMYVQDLKPDAWYLLRTSVGWSKPYKFWNNPTTKHYMQTTDAGNYYLTYNLKGPIRGNISKILIKNADTIVQSLGDPINSTDNGVDFFVSKDETYMIFVRHPGGVNGDLFITFLLKNGNWSTPEKLNTLINSPCWEWGPFVTNDNQYLFFTRGCPNERPSVFWVSIGKEIALLRSKTFMNVK